jgi:hypothetical protein
VYVLTKDGAQVIALFCAGAYFIVKALQGFFVVDLSLDLELKRIPMSQSEFDYLIATARLKRGSQGSFKVQQAVAILRQNGNAVEMKKLGIERYQTVKKDGYQILIDSKVKSVPTLNLAPGDETTLSAWWKVDRLEPCVVEVVVVGTKFRSSKRAQWRASAVSVYEPASSAKAARMGGLSA